MEAIMNWNHRTRYGTCLMILCAVAVVANVLGHPAATLALNGSHLLTAAGAASTMGGVVVGACAIGVGIAAGVLFAGFDGLTLGGGSFLIPLALSAAINASAVICAS
jgi:hypothetical protein